jgi:excisionase family DNA binding protein
MASIIAVPGTGGSPPRNSRTARRAGSSTDRRAAAHMASDDEILTVKELCDLLRSHPSTVYNLARRGQIPGFRVGTDWRFRKDAIERWMTEQTIYAQGVRKVIETGANGEARRRRRAALRRQPGPKL